MPTKKETAETFRALLKKDTRYALEAYDFIYEALNYTQKNIVKENRRNKHITGQQLSEGVRKYAIEQFGCLAQAVLNDWGIYTTNDIGELVFNLQEYNLMKLRKKDTRKDFDSLYDFDDVFDVFPIFNYSSNGSTTHGWPFKKPHKSTEVWEVTYATRLPRKISKKIKGALQEDTPF